MVEGAIVGLVLSILVFGMINFGLLLHQANTDSDSLRSGARTANLTGKDPNADYLILQAMKTKDVSLTDGVSKVMIFKAGADGSPQGQCTNFIADSDLCNVYNADDVDSQAAVLSKSTTWNPTNRVPGVDFIGVRVLSKYTYMTALFGTDKIFNDSGVIALEDAPLTTSGSDGFSNGSNLPVPDGSVGTNGDVGAGNGSSPGSPPGKAT